ncbi:MAG TPA: condensation domain-containing protein [Jatrophihabitans sp.]|uniref:condensation domain-containing protein n=1 Tax=Jatrophihabitans sp. TaxID=1932789 RepID=UPI002F0C3B74
MTASPPTIADKRAELRDRLLRQRRQQQQNSDQITAEPETSTAPLSSQQSGLWLAAQLARAPGYTLVNATWLRGPLDSSLLRAALDGLIERHQSLRTSFPEQDGAPRLTVAPTGQLWWEELDLCRVPEPNRRQRGLEALAAWAEQVIDLRHPLLRTLLVRLDTGEHLFGYLQHHIVSDGWSIPILVSELSELYRAAAEQRSPRLPAQTIQPTDVYRWQRERLATEPVRQRLNRWRDQLAGMPQLRFPTDRPRPAVASWAGHQVVVDLPAELIARADAVARTGDRLPFAVLLAAFSVLMRQRSGQHDLALGTAFSGRVRTEMEPLIGYFANTGVLRIRTAAEQGLDELIGHCHDVVLDAEGMQDIPFADVVNAVAPARVPGANPLFQICFTLARGAILVPALDLEGVEVEPVRVRAPGSRFDITFQVTELPDGRYRMEIEYATELFDEQTIHQLAKDYRTLLALMLASDAVSELTVAQLQQAAGLPSPAAAVASGDRDEVGAGPVDAGPVDAGPVDARPVGKEPVDAGPAAPSGPAEPDALRDQVARIWVAVFGVTGDFDDDESFFEVGGSSIMAVRLRAQLLSEFGIDLPLADIFAGGSVAELTDYLSARLAEVS